MQTTLLKDRPNKNMTWTRDTPCVMW